MTALGVWTVDLFSFVNLAAATCEARADDDESKNATWRAALFTLSHGPTVFEQQNKAEWWKYAAPEGLIIIFKS